LRAWPAQEVALWPLEQIHPYPHNARVHSDVQVRQLAESMLRWGVTAPVLVDEDGVLLYGHGRRRAALLLVAEGHAQFAMLPVSVARGWPEDDKRAYRLADNQLGLLAEWDGTLLSGELSWLKLAHYDLPLIGFDQTQLAKHLPAEPLDDPDADAGEPPAEPVTQPGDLWQLGAHRVLCGDATDASAWARLFGELRAAMVFTDPPYGVSYKSKKYGGILGDKTGGDEVFAMAVKALRCMASFTVPAAAFYIWHASTTHEDFAQAMKAAGLIERQHIIWIKPGITLGHSDYNWGHETCFYASKEGRPAFYGDRTGTTVWHVSFGDARERAVTIGSGLALLDGSGGTLFVQAQAPKSKKLRQLRLPDAGTVALVGNDRGGAVWEVRRDAGYLHPTQKPVELARRAIENSSRAGEIVADGFLGAGTTVIAAELTGRRCYGLELSPGYCDVIVRRWEKVTGKQAVRLSAARREMSNFLTAP
jgi:DNA modification methylase